MQFTAVELENCPDIDGEDLSTDQQYLYNICHAISVGQSSNDLALQKPGPIVHSRWLTTANRLLRLYVTTENPSETLRNLVMYVMKVHAPVWFHIKTKSSCSDGSRHLWRMIKFSRNLTPELKAIVDPVIQRNGYFGTSENILIVMFTDDRLEIREVGYRRIVAAL